MPASYWGLLAKVGPYKLTKTDQKHLHERGNNKHYTSAFTRMRPSSLGSEVLPPGQQDNSNLLPKIFKGMVPDPNFRGVVTGRNPANYPQTTSDRDRAIFNTMENMGYADKNVSNLDTEQRPVGPYSASNTPLNSPTTENALRRLNDLRRPSVSPVNLPFYNVDESAIDETAAALRDYLNQNHSSSSGSPSGILTPMSMDSSEWYYNPTYDRKRSITSPTYNIGQNKRFKKGLTIRIPKRSNQTSRYTQEAEYQPKLERGIKRKAEPIGKKAKKPKSAHTFVRQFTPKAVIEDNPKNRKLEAMLNRGTNPERSQASKILAKKINLKFK